MSAAALSWGSLGWVALGGAVGSVARVLLGRALPAGALPWGTLAANVAGSLLIGWLMARTAPLEAGGLRMHSLGVAGFCGGFTTFSTFSWQTVEQMQKGQWGTAAVHVLVSVTVCLLATWLGWRLAR